MKLACELVFRGITGAFLRSVGQVSIAMTNKHMKNQIYLDRKGSTTDYCIRLFVRLEFLLCDSLEDVRRLALFRLRVHRVRAAEHGLGGRGGSRGERALPLFLLAVASRLLAVPRPARIAKLEARVRGNHGATARRRAYTRHKGRGVAGEGRGRARFGGFLRRGRGKGAGGRVIGHVGNVGKGGSRRSHGLSSGQRSDNDLKASSTRQREQATLYSTRPSRRVQLLPDLT